MPTGYTAAIADGISFEQFAWSCARAFGALITMRDDPMDAPIPKKLEPSPYHAEAAAKARAALRDLEAMSQAQLIAAAAKESEDQRLSDLGYIEKKRALKQRYEAMLARVQAWTPPTPDHVKMKEFMVEQITGSIKFDCDLSYYQDREPVAPLAPEAWRQKERDRLVADMAYHDTHYAEEVARTDDRNRWIQALRESLQGETVRG